MGKRRGRTGPGGAVVSSLSGNSGGTVRPGRGGRGGGRAFASGASARGRDDAELAELANPRSEEEKKGKRIGAAGSRGEASSSLSAPGATSKWLGKSPSQMLREWCAKNNRKRPFFSKMSGCERFRCTIPQGRKDGKKSKGSTFDLVVGVGDVPGEEYAALNVLHQVERGKPLERLLAPEFRDLWLGLDKRFAEVHEENTQRANNRERRKEQAERRAKFEKSKESATINISAASRQLIEDALLEHKAPNSDAGESGSKSTPASTWTGGSNVQSQVKLKNELVRMGFTEFDATDASDRFSDVSAALDYLCLNLDEAELPSSFAPTADVEVVQFYSASGKQPRSRIDLRTRDVLVGLFSLSKHAAEKSLKKADGDFARAVVLLYGTLTHGLLEGDIFRDRSEEERRSAQKEKEMEGETIRAIYGDDSAVGVGVMPGFEANWAAVIRICEGFVGAKVSEPVLVAVVDVDGLYPFSPPVIFMGVRSVELGKIGPITASQRRMLMRAAAGTVASIRCSSGAIADLSNDAIAVPVIHGVLSFLADASDKELLRSASSAGLAAKRSDSVVPRENLQASKEGRPFGTQGLKSSSRSSWRQTNLDIPRRVPPLRDSKQLEAMRKRRSALPAHNSRAEILAKVKENQIVVVSGATGSGKTTQVPQFLLEDASMTGQAISIVCTQPRRIAAISVAERVATERCQTVGESVGYQVKLNTKRSGSTRLLFCTTGVLLRKLQGDPQLESLTHVLVDEVHERSVETDFLLLLLREIVFRRPDLRVVLMSATLDADKFSLYFSSAMSKNGRDVFVPVISIPGRTFPVDELYLEDAVLLSGYRIKAGDRYAKRFGKSANQGKYGMEPPADAVWPKAQNSATAASAEYVALDDARVGEESQVQGAWDDEFIAASQVPRQSEITSAECKSSVSLIDEAVVNVDLIDLLVNRIDLGNRGLSDSGAILIFLPGAAEISAVMRKLSSGPRAHSLWPIPLHSLLSPEEQAKVFSRPPKGKRKVICATNIAETSITVEDVTVVIDSMRAKEMSYDALNISSVLEEGFISKAAAKQRAGRAGRVSKGTCYRLVKKHTFDNRIAAQQTPEIQRVALEHLVLHMLSIVPETQSRNDPHAFLGNAIDPPDAQSISTALSTLIAIGALKRRSDAVTRHATQVELTALGRHLTGMPVDAKIGKLLIFGSLFSCVDAALTIAATLSERSPFFAPFDKREEARTARIPFVWGKSDLLTYVKAFNMWRDVQEARRGYAFEKEFCSKNFLARKTLMSISDGRKQLADALSDAGFGLPGVGRSRRGWERDPDVNQYSTNVRVLKAIVCAALYPNIARIDLPDTTYHEVAAGTVANKHHSKDLRLRSKGGERLFLHPESVNFHEGNYETRWLAYFSKVKTSRLFVRDSTMVSPYAILLFGGEIGVQHEKGRMSVDNWVIFKAPARVAVLARELRRKLDGVLMRKFEDADVDLAKEGKAINEAIIRLITLES